MVVDTFMRVLQVRLTGWVLVPFSLGGFLGFGTISLIPVRVDGTGLELMLRRTAWAC
jgi:pimeloyl-ACP methyl ester carboxylesterase